MKSKRIISVLLASMLTASLVAGCTGNENTQSSSGGEKTADKKEAVELIWNVVGTPQDDQKAVFEEVNKTLNEKLNTTVRFNIIDWGSYDEKMKVSIATNEYFDMCFTSDWTNPYTSNAQKGAYLALDDLLKQHGKNIMEQVPEDYWKATKINDQIYGVVNYQICARIQGISFPKDVVEELNYDVSKIKKYSDLTDYFKTVKEKKPDMTPFLGIMDKASMPMLITNETGFSMDYLSGPLAVKATDTTKAINAVETPEFMEFCKMTRDWYQKGYVRKDVASISDAKAEAKTHKYAAFATGVGPGSPEVEGASAGFTLVQAQTVPSFLSTGSIQAALTAISKNSKNPDRAMMVLDYLFEDKDTYNTLCYGLKDKHYKQATDTSLEIIEDGGYNPGIAWVFGSWFNADTLKGQPEDLWAQLKNVNETALQSPVLGFVYDSSKVKTESAQISAMMSEYLPGLLSGSVDPTKKIPELIGKMNKAGMDKIIKDANEQLATFNK